MELNLFLWHDSDLTLVVLVTLVIVLVVVGHIASKGVVNLLQKVEGKKGQ